MSDFMSPDTYYQHKWYGQNDSPTGHGDQTYFSPYASQYSSPVSQTGVIGRDWQGISGAGSSMGMSSMHNAEDRGAEDNIELSPMSESDHARWAQEVGEVGFTPSPIQPAVQAHEHRGDSDGMGVAI